VRELARVRLLLPTPHPAGVRELVRHEQKCRVTAGIAGATTVLLLALRVIGNRLVLCHRSNEGRYPRPELGGDAGQLEVGVLNQVVKEAGGCELAVAAGVADEGRYLGWMLELLLRSVRLSGEGPRLLGHFHGPQE
jgi:hypothetical protein